MSKRVALKTGLLCSEEMSTQDMKPSLNTTEFHALSTERSDTRDASVLITIRAVLLRSGEYSAVICASDLHDVNYQ
jgi:hypothetical protein